MDGSAGGRRMRFPPLTEESRICRNGHHETYLTLLGQAIGCLIGAAIIGVVGVLLNWWLIARWVR
jgi:hypothetical protein